MAKSVLPASYIGRHGPRLATLLAELTALRTAMLGRADQAADQLQAVHPDFRLSARNLLHYLALRQHDRRAL